jgi:NitT/TauT family transport system permease protein
MDSASNAPGGIERPNDWQAAPSAESFRRKPRAGMSRRTRLARRIGWNLLPPLTFAAMVALWWGAVVFFKIPPICCRARARCSRES